MDAISPQSATAAAAGTQTLAVDSGGRKLARIVKVLAVEPISGADRIVLYTVLGWKVIGQKDQFEIGGLVIYFEIDSLLPNNPTDPWAFLDGKPLKTKKMRGVISQGLIGPLDWLPKDFDRSGAQEGLDVTTVLGVKKFVADEERKVYESSSSRPNLAPTRAPFPENLVPKTDEERVQSLTPGALDQLVGRPCVITRKEDGTSTTVIYNGNNVQICSRNNVLLVNGPDTKEYFEMVEKYKLVEKLHVLKRNIAIQGETCGPKINGGRTKIKENDFLVFNIVDIDKKIYLNWSDVRTICSSLGLKTVPVIWEGIFPKEWASVQTLLDLANKQEYAPKVPAEGIVLKTSDDPEKRFSCKIISNNYLLKNAV